MTENIWKQPAKGFDEESVGKTEEEMVQKETELGFKFPHLYREHMKMQNGGYLWKRALVQNGEVNELLYNGSTFDPIKNHRGYKTLKGVLLEYMDQEELEKISKSGFLDLNRLPILSHMDGHTMLCFDYGYNVESEYEIPEIVYFELECAENGFEEKFRLKSYDELIANMVYYGYESTSFFIGLKSEEPIDKIAEEFNKIFKCQLKLHNDDRFGWYNFEKWFSVLLNLNSSLSAYVVITPNQFLSNTSLFQNNKEFNYILEIDLRIGGDSFQDNSNYLRILIEEKLESFLSQYNWEFLLVPYNKDNYEELNRIRKTFDSNK